MSPVDIQPWDGTDEQLVQVADLYAAVFAEPPYLEDVAATRAEILERIPRYASTKPAFRLLLAWDGRALAGFVLGAGADDADWWRGRLRDAELDDAAHDWLERDYFSVAELAVAPAHRRNGLAGRLMRCALDGVPYDTAVLTCYAAASAARRFYENDGWRLIAEDLLIGTSPPLCILGTRLTQE